MSKNKQSNFKQYLLVIALAFLFVLVIIGQFSNLLASVSISMPASSYSEYVTGEVVCAVGPSNVALTQEKGMGWPVFQERFSEPASINNDSVTCEEPGYNSTVAKYINLAVGVGSLSGLVLILSKKFK